MSSHSESINNNQVAICPGNCRRDYGLNKSLEIKHILEAFFRTGFETPESVKPTCLDLCLFLSLVVGALVCLLAIYRELGDDV